MKVNARTYLTLGAATLMMAAIWFLLPGSFGHGVIVGIAGVIAAIIAAFAMLGRRMRKRFGGELKPPPLPITSWDYQMELTDMAGQSFNFANAGGNVIVLNFWATWCAPCVAEMPSLGRLVDQTTDLDVRFAFVSREDVAMVRPFIDKHAITLPVYLLAGEPPDCFKGRGIPSTFVIDKTGLIVMRHMGAAAWDAEAVVGFIRGLAAKPMG